VHLARHVFDLVIVGAGPAGLSAAAQAAAFGMSYVLLERTDHLADTIFRYQKRKPVMAEPGMIPLRGDLRFEAGLREAVLGEWEGFASSRDLNVHFRRELTAIEKAGDRFLLRAGGDEYEARSVVLAIGTQGNPRRLGAPGEELPHVTAYLSDPDEFQGQDMVVVGAGDSALETVIALAGQNNVTLVVRRGAIAENAKDSLEREVLVLKERGRIKIQFNTTISRVEPDRVELKTPEGLSWIPARHVILRLGAEPPRDFLQKIGVRFSGPERGAKPVLNHRSESTVPGLYLIGAVMGRDLIKLGMNQGWEVVHHVLGLDVEPADEEILKERLPFWSGTVRERIEELRQRVPLLAAASPESLREAFVSAQTREYRDGEVILRQNDYTNHFLIVAGGEVEISTRLETGEVKKVAVLAEGGFFGEMGLISGRRRTSTAVAREGGRGGARLIEIPRKAMLSLIANEPAVREMVDQAFLVRAFQGYLFPGVPEAPLREVAAQAALARFDANQVIFREGDPGDSFYLIRSGQVKISKVVDGKEIVLSYLVGGNFFGETSLLPDVPRTATVTTIFPSELIRLGREDFDRFLDDRPDLRAGFTGRLEHRRVAALAAIAQPVKGGVLSDLIREEVVMGTQALFIDDHKCIRCGNCISACEGVHDDGQARLSLTGIKFYNLLAPNSCWQCENPLCMLDCPPDAIARDPHGEVFIKSNCIGCGKCEENCPYGNIFMVHPQKERTLFDWVRSLLHIGSQEKPVDPGKTVAVKCDLCREIDGGPACVRSCPTGAAIRLEPGEYQRRLEDIVARSGGF
jgi:CRP-like cAMP-binding protein/thioredoxin reductase